MNPELNKVFMSVLGRSPNEQEHDFFDKFIKEGHLQPYEIGQILEASPQMQQQRLEGQTNQYAQRLAQSDQDVLGRANDQLASMFAQQGRGMGPTSSSYISAFANAARDLAMQRTPQIAQFYGQGLQGVNQGFQAGGGAQQRGYGLRDEARHRSWDIEDYYRQANDYNSYLNAANRRNRASGMLGAGLGLAGAGIGGAFGGIGGARLGAGLGGSIGGGLGGLF